MNIAEYYQKQREGTLSSEKQVKFERECAADTEKPFGNRENRYDSNDSHKQHSNNGWKWALVVFVAILVILGVSCPNQQVHQQSISNAFSEKMSNDIQEDDSLAALVASAFTADVVNLVLNERFTVNKYVFFSVGKLRRLDGSYKTVSFGILGHVFVQDIDELK